MQRLLMTAVAGLLLAGSVSAQIPQQMAMPNPAAQQQIPDRPAGYDARGAWNPDMIAPNRPPVEDTSKKRHGWLPAFRNLFGRKSSTGAAGGCSNCGADGGAAGLNAGAGASTGLFNKNQFTAPPPQANGGTLVFPNHQFVRSPRDFFMQD